MIHDEQIDQGIEFGGGQFAKLFVPLRIFDGMLRVERIELRDASVRDPSRRLLVIRRKKTTTPSSTNAIGRAIGGVTVSA